ncbi:MAG: hypothetical protein C5B56_01535 [Proteobacteria bacterium]|nr:MAG: hypothetical protein C5B56_01535 [Pseudomonadota bacterium]
MRIRWGATRVAPLLSLVMAMPTQSANDLRTMSRQQALDTAIDAYVYGYPLVTMEITRRVMTNVEWPDGTRAPMGQFRHMTAFPDAGFRDVTAPNADTLYSSAWVDVSREPWILSLPDAGGRYYLMPMLSAWTDVFANPGTRTTGTGPQKYAITGPGWKGALPPGVTEYKSPTGLVWILGRTYSAGTPQDLWDVHAFQNRMSLTPLSNHGKLYVLPGGVVDRSVDMKTPVRDQVNRLDAATYFKLMAALMKNNPPAPADAPMVARMARIGLVPGRDFDFAALDPAVADALRAAPEAGLARIRDHSADAGVSVNGWMIDTKDIGVYGTAYLQRAAVAMMGLGANLPADAVYAMTASGPDGRSYDGRNHYRLHFAKGELPPVEGFWSLTLYDRNYLFVPNPLDRYNLGGRNPLKYNPDGSLDIYLQADDPGLEKVSNWLPAPRDEFVLFLRLYWPRQRPPSILDGTWKPPAVQKAG